MTREDKQLLLQDLCARLPYGVQVCYKIHLEDELIDVTLSGLLLDYFNNKTVVEIKPYLRPMSSMSEEERNEYFNVKMQECERVALSETYRPEAISVVFDWLNAHHFDYRGLIDLGLALSAPEEMYNK